jgi:hypothetical protein
MKTFFWRDAIEAGVICRVRFTMIGALGVTRSTVNGPQGRGYSNES